MTKLINWFNCPFCGGYFDGEYDQKNGETMLTCEGDCGVITVFQDNEQIVYDRWKATREWKRQ